MRCRYLAGVTVSEFPVHRAHKNMTMPAMPKRTPAVVKIPSPVRLIFIATALAPNRIQRNMVNSDAPRGSPWLMGKGANSFFSVSNGLPYVKHVNPSRLCSIQSGKDCNVCCRSLWSYNSISWPNSKTMTFLPIVSTCFLNSFGSASITGNVL